MDGFGWNSISLGVRPTLTGLMIDPCIPADWKQFKVVREYRGVLYRIKVLNPDGVVKEVKAVKVNGQLIEGVVIDPSRVGSEGEIEVVMGAK